MKRLRIVQIVVTVTSAVDNGDDLHTEQGQPVSFPTMRAFQEFAATSLPAQMAAVEAKLNADRAFPHFPIGSEKQEQALVNGVEALA